MDDGNVLFWHRNQERGRGYCINGFINHYPDFIVRLRTGQTLLIEAKGDDRDNADSRRKLAPGTKWAAMVGTEYRYFMVFNTKKLDGAKTITQLLGSLSEFERL